MFGSVNQDSFGANWGITDLNQFENNDGGFFEEDLSNFITDDAVNKDASEINKKKTFMPIKISMIYSSWKAGANFISIFGYHLEIVKIVGTIKDVKLNEDEVLFTIDDGSGSVDCIFMMSENTSEWRRNYIDRLIKSKPSVKVYGGFNPLYSSDGPTIMIFSIKELDSPDEAKLHELDVIYSILLNDGKHNPKVMDALSEMDSILKEFQIVNPQKSQKSQETQEKTPLVPEPVAPGDTTKVLANEGALSKFVLSMLVNETKNNNANGLHISEIVKRCRLMHSFQSVQEQHVRKVLNDLSMDTSVYQSLDSDTYASCGL